MNGTENTPPPPPPGGAPHSDQVRPSTRWQDQNWGQHPPAPPVPTPARTAQQSWFGRHKILTGLLLLLALAVLVPAFGGGAEPEPSGAAAPAPPASENASGTAEAPAPDEPGIGDAVRDGDFEFVVSEVQTGADSVGSGLTAEEAHGQFVLVHLNVHNIGEDPQTFFDGNQVLVDAAGREHSTSSAAIWLEDNDLWLQDINPGNRVAGVLLFDLPADAEPAALQLHDSAFSGGVQVHLQ